MAFADVMLAMASVAMTSVTFPIAPSRASNCFMKPVRPAMALAGSVSASATSRSAAAMYSFSGC